MTKTRLASAIAALALMAAPGVALAQGSHGKHHKSHAKKHQVRKAKIRQVVGTSPSTTTPSSTTPPPAATTAKVTSFDTKTGDLTITLSNGKVYTAAVTDRTEIECETAAIPTARAANDGGDDNHGQGDNSGRSHDNGDDESGDDDQGDVNDGDDDDDNGSPVTCDKSALTPGTQVTEAELAIDSSGGVWKKLQLVK